MLSGQKHLLVFYLFFFLVVKEMRRIENSDEDISKFKALVKLYDRADIINDIA